MTHVHSRILVLAMGMEEVKGDTHITVDQRYILINVETFISNYLVDGVGLVSA